MRHATYANKSDIQIIKQNKYINIARNVIGLPLYVLESDELGNYYPPENAWHNCQIELLMRRAKQKSLLRFWGIF